MEPMVVISVKDYNILVRNSGDKRVLELLEMMFEVVKEKREELSAGGTFEPFEILLSFYRNLKYGGSCFEELMERYKKELLHENTKEDKEGSEVR